ncbi:hypothetical protein QCE73_04790 [Caballeronia sp. LZ029]|uniref:hypothetical protein n=1 Tax=Caballeronia sp. LZ029 TaxID=3038564 RepID=UPI002860277F|nr:hypothetical protein [Caballeronia sp. LZ029]MDR5742471.1 hypothetical protein [Caballeronia sp. LZ029]
MLNDEEIMSAIVAACDFDRAGVERWRTEALTIGRAVVSAAIKASDTARLDFMVRAGAVVQWYGETCQLHGSAGVISGKGEFYDSAREAIDAAMTREKQCAN